MDLKDQISAPKVGAKKASGAAKQLSFLGSISRHIQENTPNVLFTAKITSLTLFLIYVGFPIFVRSNPWILPRVVFANLLRWPPFVNLSAPSDFGLVNARNFYLDVEDGVRVGAWQVLPKSGRSLPLEKFEDELKNGKKVFLYLHGNSGTRGSHHRVQLYKLLASLDFHVVTIDYRVMEIPMEPTLDALRVRKVLTDHDYEQLRTLRHQGRRALARYLLAVLPARGSRAFQALLESLQEANAQHLVDLLVAQSGSENVDQLIQISENSEIKLPQRALATPSDTPLPPGPDPHEYAVRLARNNKLIREFVDPSSISPVLAQNKIISVREADMVLHLSGKNKKWDLILSAILQRGERAFQAFMAALLQKGYSTMFHTIQETPTVGSDTEPELDPVGFNSDDDHSVDKGRTSKSAQTNSRLDGRFTSGKKNAVDADTQTQRPLSRDTQQNSPNDVHRNGPSSRGPSRDSREGDESQPGGQNDMRPATSNSIQSNGVSPYNTNDVSTASNSPSGHQRRRSSNGGNLQSLHSNGVSPNNTNDVSTANNSPSGHQRRRSSNGGNLQSLQEQDEHMHQ